MANEYDALKALAREKRLAYSVETTSLNLKVIRSIYHREGVTIDLWEAPSAIRAAYLCDDGNPSVMLNLKLPREPRLFALAHELKHHFTDRERIASGGIKCGDYNANRAIEVGAEVFAAEFIYPESEFLESVQGLGLRNAAIEPEDVVRFKREVKAPISYTFLRKRFELFGLIQRGAFSNVQFRKLEEKIYGLPIYKQPWFVNTRARRRSRA